MSDTVKSSRTSKPSGPSEIRKHYYLDQYVIISPKRGLRGDSFSHASESHKSATTTCVFCNNTEKSLLSLPQAKDWQVKVVANAFPALSVTNPKAYGVQEVIIDTPDHDTEFSELSLEHITLILTSYRDRLASLKAQPGISYVLVFKNDGPVAGATVAHSHCQIIALPLVPPQIEKERDALNHYRDQHSTCAHCDAIDWEAKQKVRLLFEDKHIIAIAPYASDVHFEAWIMTREHRNTLTELNLSELHSLAVVLKKLTARLDAASMSFNFYLQESTVGQDHHFFIKLKPRSVKQWAGAELGTGVIINPVPPEYAALWYQNKVE